MIYWNFDKMMESDNILHLAFYRLSADGRPHSLSGNPQRAQKRPSEHEAIAQDTLDVGQALAVGQYEEAGELVAQQVEICDRPEFDSRYDGFAAFVGHYMCDQQAWMAPDLDKLHYWVVPIQRDEFDERCRWDGGYT